ncbi:hypothetical protein LCGC14_2029200 [marine sediment metagenome]|uniref:Uncharacterized protein n=1 Tax=marine sediment metagenome TaxID=412755 RepID=A0A0F9FHP7_9ZZZZ
MNRALDKRTGTLDIGLSYFQEEQWIAAISKYGKPIMGKSLLSQQQKAILASEQIARSINKASY